MKQLFGLLRLWLHARRLVQMQKTRDVLYSALVMQDLQIQRALQAREEVRKALVSPMPNVVESRAPISITNLH